MSAAQPSGRVLPAIWNLLRMSVRIRFNNFRHARLIRKILLIVTGLVLLSFAGFAFFLSMMLLGFLRSPALSQLAGLDAAPLLQAVPVLILSGMFVGILLTSFGVLLQALYLAGDMDFLLSAPVPIRAVFAAKLMQAVLPNFGLACLFGLPILFGLGISGGYNVLYYPLLILVLIALALVSAGFSSLIVMLVARVFPARRAAEIITFFGAIFAILCSQVGNFTQTFADKSTFTNAQMGRLADLVVRANAPWFPLNWAGRGLVDLGEGRWLSGTLLLLLTLGLCAAGFWFALTTAERWYYTGWASMQVVTRKKRPPKVTPPAADLEAGLPSWAERLFPAPVRAILRKDFLTLRRDLRNLSQVISPLILGVVYTLAIFQSGGEPPPGQGDAPAWFMESLHVILTYSSVGIALFVGWMLLGRLAGMSFSKEGKSYWVLKSAPLRACDLLAAKFLAAYLPTLAMGWFFVIVISLVQKVSAAGFVYSLLAVALSLAGMNGIMIAFGAAGANFNWDDPRKMNAGSLGCLGQIVTMLVLPITFGLFVAPVWLAAALQWPLGYAYAAGALLGTAANLLCAYLPLKFVEARVQRLGEVE